MEYGVMTTNKFKFLSDDETEDPFESLVKVEQAKKDKPLQTKKEKKAAVVIKPVITAPPPKAEPEKQQHRQANKENESRENRGGLRGSQRGGRGGNRVNFAERKDAGNRQNDGVQDVIADRFGETRPPRRGDISGGRGAATGGRGGFSSFRGGPRRGVSGRGGGADRHNDTHEIGFRSGGENEEENRGPRGGGGVGRYRGGWRRGVSSRGDRHLGGDRHSGSDRTGVKATTKREGYGKGNWGTESDELVGETESVLPVNDTDALKPEDHTETEAPKEMEIEESKREEEEKPKELTLDEWKALQKIEQPVFHIRRAGEGEDQKKYSKLIPLKKEEEPEEHEEVVIVRREPREKPLNIEVSFSDANRPRGGATERGFRGNRERDEFRGRGGLDRREFRGSGRGRKANFALNDEAFPALGGKA